MIQFVGNIDNGCQGLLLLQEELDVDDRKSNARSIQAEANLEYHRQASSE
jgi:hypothetical protein